MKTKLIALLLLLSLVLSAASCGEHKPAVDPDNGNTGTDNPGGNTGDTDDSSGSTGDEDEKDEPFVTTVMLDGNVYVPLNVSNPDKALMVRWSDGKNAYTEPVGQDGKAVVTGLDGDYTVTLLNVPDGYTYNPNIYTAGNDKREISVELLQVTKTFGVGSKLYDAIKLSKTGVYRATLTSEKSVVYYEFRPTKSGLYQIESMIDVSADMYNPIVTPYVGTEYKNKISANTSGGVSGTYTKNFKCVFNVSEDERAGYAYTIELQIEGKDAVFPAYIDFQVVYMGTYEEEFYSANLISPEFDFSDASKFPEGYVKYLMDDMVTFGSAWKDASVSLYGVRVFDEDYYKLNPKDGFYHVYDETKYASTGGWGPILYADITIPHIFSIDGAGLNTIEYTGNKALTVSESTENYKLFIEGYNGVTNVTGHYYFCNSDCPCRPSNGGGCKESDRCEDCRATCRPVPDWAYNKKGYADYAVGGRAPVTEELKIFLQKFSVSERYFSDGNGWVESFGYTAFEDSQWLFCCGYYTN